MNEIKRVGAEVGALVERLRRAPPPDARVNGEPALVTLDQRWVSIGATNLQQGFMALTRAVAQPTFF